MGLTHRRAVLILYGVSLALTAAAIGVYLGRSWQVGIALLSATAVLVGLVRFVGYYEYLFLVRRQRVRLRAPDTEAMRRVVPRVPALLDAALTEDAVWRALESVVALGGLARIELHLLGEREELRAWEGNRKPEPHELVSATFPIGEERLARAELRFRWASASGEVTAPTEILLQVVVDMAAAALLRVRSEFAPLPQVERAEPEPAPSVRTLPQGT
jgi:UDP-GlcNAc:undecaprenyl-phosphate GlcNAc-1-phosphate transferase